MNIILVHGDNTEDSYKRLLTFIDEAIKRNWKIEKIDKSSKNDLRSMVKAESLFNEERIFIVYGFNTLNKKDHEWLKERSSEVEGTLVIYEKNTASATTLKHLPKGYKSEKYELPKLLFKFLDSFYPGNKTASIKLFHEVIKTYSIEFVFTLLASHIKDLYWVMVEPSKIPYPSWRVARLENQAGNFDKDHLNEILAKLAVIDIDVKTSKATLTQSLDLLIIRELE
jgi:DNA polymerase III delta subunit